MFVQNASRVKRDHSDEEDESDLDNEDAEEVSLTKLDNFSHTFCNLYQMADFIDDAQIQDGQEGSKKQRKHRKRKKAVNYRLDDEDREIIKENTGIELKPKNRLKRNADKDGDNRQSSLEDDKALVKKEIEVREKQAQQTMQIDTTKKRPYKGELKCNGDYHDDANLERQYENADKLRQAHEIFGDDDEQLELP